MNIRNLAIAAVLAGAGTTGLVATALPAHASTISSGQSTFCHDWARFGDNPTFGNFITVHDAAAHATATTHHLYSQFEAALLAGKPVTVLRRDTDAVYRACGDRSA